MKREQATETTTIFASSRGNRHWILNVAPKNVPLVTMESRVKSKNLKNLC